MPDPRPRPVADAALDLMLGGRCVGCDRPGRIWCTDCARWAGDVAAVPAVTAGLTLPTWAAGAYEGALRRLVIGHKERRLVRLRPVLGGLLAGSVLALLASSDAVGPVLLVPVPSRWRVTRARGYAPTDAMTSAAAALLRRAGHDVVTRPLLRVRRGVVDQSGLSEEQRRTNARHGLAARPGALRAWVREEHPAHVVVCDDIVTTGSTISEAARALGAVGLPPLGACVVAATPRRSLTR